MEKKKAIVKLHPEGEVNTCPSCGYGDGFHVSFKVDEENGAGIILICPRCSSRFQIGWQIRLDDV